MIFRQNHPSGRQDMSDFFDARDLAVTIAGQPLAHLIHHSTLVYSGWEHGEAVLGGESFAALSTGLRDTPSGGSAASRTSTAPTARVRRAFIALTVGRHDARRREALRIEAAHLRLLPRRRSGDFDEAAVRVTSSGGFTLRKVFCTVPWRLIGHHLRTRLHDDRVELYLAGRCFETLPRGRAPDGGRGGRAHIVNHHHVIHSLRGKPQALANLIYRDGLFPRTEYRRCRKALEAAQPRAMAQSVRSGRERFVLPQSRAIRCDRIGHSRARPR